MNPSSAPYLTKKSEAAWRKRVREDHRRCWERNPALMRRLKKLSHDQLLRLEILTLETLEPASAARDQALRFAVEWERLRAMPKPVKRGRVKRLRDLPTEEQPCPLQGTTPRGPGLGSPDLPAPTNTVEADKSGPPAALPAPKPSNNNVIFCSRFFHAGKTSPVWIGGE